MKKLAVCHTINPNSKTSGLSAPTTLLVVRLRLWSIICYCLHVPDIYWSCVRDTMNFHSISLHVRSNIYLVNTYHSRLNRIKMTTVVTKALANSRKRHIGIKLFKSKGSFSKTRKLSYIADVSVGNFLGHFIYTSK
jgi:hypothetical protein